MVDEHPEPIDVLHPLVGVDPPSATSLLERSAADAQQVLESAIRLYALRRRERIGIEATMGRQAAAQWPVPFPTVGPSSVGLQEADLLRALLAERPKSMAAPLGDNLLRHEFDELVALCRNRLRVARESIDDDALDHVLEHDGLEVRWAQRWALADERHGYPRITVEYLIAALGADGLEPLNRCNELYSEGLLTARETAWRFIGRAAIEIGSRSFTPVPAAYLDRGGLLETLSQAVSESGRVLIVGEPHSGRSALLRAWWGPGDDQLGRRLDPHVVLHVDELELLEEPVLVGLTAPRSSAGTLERFANQGYITDPTAVRRCRDEWLAMHAEYLGAEDCEAVVVVGPDDEAKLRRSVPALAEFARVHVPTPTALERAMIWLAHTMVDPRLGVGQVLAAMRRLSYEEFDRIDPWALEQCIASKFLQGFLDREAALSALTYRSTDRLLERHARGESISERSWSRGLHRVGGRVGVEALLELQERLHGARPPGT